MNESEILELVDTLLEKINEDLKMHQLIIDHMVENPNIVLSTTIDKCRMLVIDNMNRLNITNELTKQCGKLAVSGCKDRNLIEVIDKVSKINNILYTLIFSCMKLVIEHSD